MLNTRTLVSIFGNGTFFLFPVQLFLIDL